MLGFIKKNNLELLGPKPQRKLLFLRGVVGSIAVIIGFFSIRYLDVSDVETLSNSSVILTAILSRIFLKEKLTVCHILSLIFTISGVLFIVRPSFLFGIEQDLETFFHVNLTYENHTIHNVQLKDHLHRTFIETMIGVTMVLISAFCLSIAQVTIRKLCLGKVHFSITSLYPAMVGLPSSICVSLFLIKTNASHQDLKQEAAFLPIEIMFSVIAGLLGTMGIIFLNKALNCEDATKIGMVKTSGVFFSFILQYLFLDITVDFLGILGAMFIIGGTVAVMTVKVCNEKLSKSNNFFIKFLIKQL